MATGCPGCPHEGEEGDDCGKVDCHQKGGEFPYLLHLHDPNVQREDSARQRRYPRRCCCVPGMARLLAGALRERTKTEIRVKRIISVAVRSTGKSGLVIGNVKSSRRHPPSHATAGQEGSAGNGPLRKPARHAVARRAYSVTTARNVAVSSGRMRREVSWKERDALHSPPAEAGGQ